MAIDQRHLGRRYGPFHFHVGSESIRDFVAAVGGGVPGHVFPCPPVLYHPDTFDADSSKLLAPPTFAATFAMEPFAKACADPELALNVLRLVHSEQAFEFFQAVRSGDVLATTGEITGIRERGRMDFLEVTTTTTNQNGELVVRGVWTAIIR